MTMVSALSSAVGDGRLEDVAPVVRRPRVESRRRGGSGLISRQVSVRFSEEGADLHEQNAGDRLQRDRAVGIGSSEAR